MSPLPDALFLKEETKQLVWQLVSRLGPKKRMAVMICDLEGKTIEQAAEELNIPEGTMISRLYHGRRELMTLLQNESKQQDIPLGDWIRD
jgi:RNA polymerase sigma-70 factor (ECF subfamily)